MNNTYKLGSLFDGSGGFPLAGALCGIEPIWASEVEPYPIAVTKTRFPHMKHLGDISKINGAEIEPVDIITFGSPCQDLSVAGKRAGLKHEDNGDDETTRSGLFMEAVRIIKEMREKTNGEYPRFAVWENVPGAFSSNKGEDFRIVLEELVKVVEPTAVMPAVPQFGWAYADSYCGNGWSLAYRVLDAQYWGVPQRRRRIYLVADFRGECAREILFEREGLRGYFAEGRTPWQATPADAERSIGADDREGEIPYTLKIRSGCEGGGKGALIQDNMSATLACNNDQYLFQPIGADPYNGDLTGDKSATLGVNCGISTGRNGVVTLEPGIAAREGGHIYEDVSGTLRANAGDNKMAVAYGISSYESNAMKSSNPHSGVYEADTSRTLDLNGGNPACNQGGIAIVEPIAVATQQGGAEITENGICPTITAAAGMSGNNQPWICQGLDAYNQALTGDKAKTLNSAASDADHVPCVVLDDQGGSQISVRHDGKSPTLRAEMHGNVPCVMESAGFCPEQSAKTRGIGYEEENSPTLRAGVTPACVYSVENHPADSRVNIDDSGKVQCLTSRMGTGGGNVPMVMEEIPKVINLNKGDVQSKTILDPSGIAPSLYAGECRGGGGECYVMEPKLFENHGQDVRFTGPLDVAPTAQAGYGEGGSTKPLVVEQVPYCKSSRARSADDATTWKHGKVANTLNTFDQGEARANELVVGTVALEGNGQRPSHRGDGYAETDKSYTLNSTEVHGVAYSTEPVLTASKASFFMRTEEELASTLVATDYKDPQLICAKGTTRYIVRRLTPTECARLQGFADRWGDIDTKSDFSYEEYRFWLDVRNTHAAINGKAVKEYNKKQMLTWYNKLHTDSAEYKLWGNGIALPTALYVIQGIAIAMEGEKND